MSAATTTTTAAAYIINTSFLEVSYSKIQV
jgi:hypothetical protein